MAAADTLAEDERVGALVLDQRPELARAAHLDPHVLGFVSRKLRRRRLHLHLRRHGVEYDDLPYVVGPFPWFKNAGRIHFGAGVMFGSARIAPIRLETGSEGELVIGEGTGIGFRVGIHASSRVEIGEGTMIADNSIIDDDTWHPIDEVTPRRIAPITIGRNVWIGRRVMVLPGVTIGDHAVIASGSVVTHDIPARTLAAGVPAAPRKELVASDGWRRT